MRGKGERGMAFPSLYPPTKALAWMKRAFGVSVERSHSSTGSVQPDLLNMLMHTHAGI